MVLETRLIRGLALAASASWLALALPGSAQADDWWNSVLGVVGLGPNKPTDDSIDYSARPALVVPPKMDLPPPQTATAKPADWPNDPDVAARRKAEADSRRPAPPTPPSDASSSDNQSDQADDADQTGQTPGNQPAAAQKTKAADWIGSQSAGLSGGGTSVFGTGGQPLSLPNVSSWNPSDWNPFGKSDNTQAARTLKVGVEPQRQYLTQPPPGYRSPVAVDTDSETSQDTSAPGGAAASVSTAATPATDK
jgi:hypothetical protein